MEHPMVTALLCLGAGINKYGIKPKVDRRVNLLGKSMNSDAELAQLDRDDAAKAKKEEAVAARAASEEEAQAEGEEEESGEGTAGLGASQKSTKEDEEAARPWISFWKPNITINLVEDHTA
jgi:hypothetical protein